MTKNELKKIVKLTWDELCPTKWSEKEDWLFAHFEESLPDVLSEDSIRNRVVNECGKLLLDNHGTYYIDGNEVGEDYYGLLHLVTLIFNIHDETYER